VFLTILEITANAVGIEKPVTLPSRRQRFATRLLEAGQGLGKPYSR
jgi:hypothetical protein